MSETTTNDKEPTKERLQKWREEFESFCAAGDFEEVGYPDFGTWQAARAIDAQRIAELEEQVAAIQWQPIETAPKAMWNFILVWNSDGINEVAWHDEGYWYIDTKYSQDGLKGDNPTHWMPLPAAPTFAAAKRKGE